MSLDVQTVVTVLSALCGTIAVAWSVFQGRAMLSYQHEQANTQARIQAVDEAMKVIDLKDDQIQMQTARITYLERRVSALEKVVRDAGLTLPKDNF